MTENAMASGQQFGRMVVQTESGEVFSLVLFETPDLVCRGFYFPPAETLRQRRTEYTNATSLPMSEAVLLGSQAALYYQPQTPALASCEALSSTSDMGSEVELR